MRYSAAVSRYFVDPVNIGSLTGDSGEVLSGEAGEREHGTQVVFYMRVIERRIEQISFQAFGCPHTIAACSLATERLQGQPVTELLAIEPVALADELEVPVEKMGRLLIIQDALRHCARAWENTRLAGK